LALNERLRYVRQCEPAGRGYVLLLEVNQDKYGKSTRIYIASQINVRGQSQTSEIDGLVTGRVADFSKIPGRCHLPSGLIIT
jgi:hypothetical protein